MKKPVPKKTKPRITPALDTFAGRKLEPMTKQREVVAAEMGMRWGFVGKYIPQYFLRDVIIATWLRTLPVEAKEKQPWSVDRAEVAPDEAMKTAMAWAEKMGIAIKSERFREAHAIFMETVRQIAAVKGEPVIDDSEGEEGTTPDESGEL